MNKNDQRMAFETGPKTPTLIELRSLCGHDQIAPPSGAIAPVPTIIRRPEALGLL